MRARASLVSLTALALALRLPWLGALPSPAGDEGNWTLLALRISQGSSAGLPHDAAFVTTAFARLIAVCFTLFGPSFASARAVPVAAIVVALFVVVRLRAGIAGAFVALVLAAHPWSVMWSRTVSVPYALSFALALVGPVAWLDALRTRDPWRTLLASQLLGLAVHFSPLALIPIAACAWESLRGEGLARRQVVPALSGLAHVAWVASGALHAVRVGAQLPGEVHGSLSARLAGMTSMMLGDLAGTSTAAHFAGCPPWVSHIGLAITLCGLVAVVARARGDDLSRFTARYLALAFVGLPVMLVPARAWAMPVVDADRYGFALLAPFALALGAAASSGSRASRAAAWAFALWMCLVTVHIGHHFLRGGGGDLGLISELHGGRYRGWQVAREREALPDLLRDEVLRHARGEAAVVAYGDYAFHSLRFSLARSGNDRGVTHSLARFDAPSGRRMFFVLWSEGAFARGYEPAGVVADNRALRERIARDYADPRRARVFVTADETPLCELWSARAR